MLTKEQLEHLPVFPLPKAVFFPHTALPLHVFESRYRELTRYCLDQDWPMAIPMIASDEATDENTPPELVEVAGVGRISHHQEMPDGRYGIMLHGLARIRILQEHSTDTPYRIVRAEILPNQVSNSSTLESDIRTIRDCLTLLRSRIPNLVEALTSLTGDLAPAVLADRLGSVLFRQPTQRQRLLEEQDVGERIRIVRDRVAALAARTASTDDPVN